MVATVRAALSYIRVKLLITLIRLIVRLATPRPRATPDEVLEIPSRDAGRAIRAHVYYPPSFRGPASAASRTPLPVLINCVGTSFALPMFGADDAFCREVAGRAGHVVLDVEYRLGPEHPFPAAVHDIEDAARHVLSRPDAYDAGRVAVSGFSSGGTLALVVPTLFPARTFRSAVAFYPSVNMAGDPGERRAPVEGPSAGRAPLSWTRLFREGYVGDMDPRDPRISPLYADAVSCHYPRDMLVITAEHDVSATEAEEFARNVEGIRGTGGRVVLKRMLRCGHGFDKSKKNAAERSEAYDLAIGFLTQSVTNT